MVYCCSHWLQYVSFVARKGQKIFISSTKYGPVSFVHWKTVWSWRNALPVVSGDTRVEHLCQCQHRMLALKEVQFNWPTIFRVLFFQVNAKAEILPIYFLIKLLWPFFLGMRIKNVLIFSGSILRICVHILLINLYLFWYLKSLSCTEKRKQMLKLTHLYREFFSKACR